MDLSVVDLSGLFRALFLCSFNYTSSQPLSKFQNLTKVFLEKKSNSRIRKHKVKQLKFAEKTIKKN